MASSAYDLALLFRVAMREPLFAADHRRCATSPFPGYGDLPGFELSNTNKLMEHYPGAIGGKTGFTDAARHTLVGAAERDGRRLVVALVRGEQQPVLIWRQAAALLDWGFALPAGRAPVGMLVDAAPPPPTASARRARGRRAPSPAGGDGPHAGRWWPSAARRGRRRLRVLVARPSLLRPAAAGRAPASAAAAEGAQAEQAR